MVVFFILLAVIYFGGALALTLPYWYERGNTLCEEIPSAPYGLYSVLKLWREASWSAFLLILALPLDPILRCLEKFNQGKGNDAVSAMPPVLLVHGLYHNPTGWLYIRRPLHKAGFRKIHTMAYSSWKTNMDEVTAKLEAAVQDLERTYPGQKALLVGHSLGGLLIRNWLGSETNQQRVLGAVTLGAPHKGSKMAAIAFGTLGKSLAPANPFFSELAHRESPANIPCISLVSEADTMVLPQAGLVPVTKGWALRIAPYSTHAGILVKGSVMRMVAWELHRIANAASLKEAPSKPVAASLGSPKATSSNAATIVTVAGKKDAHSTVSTANSSLNTKTTTATGVKTATPAITKTISTKASGSDIKSKPSQKATSETKAKPKSKPKTIPKNEVASSRSAQLTDSKKKTTDRKGKK